MKISRNPEELRNVISVDLLRILGKGPGSFEIKALPQDASMRRYYRITGPMISINGMQDRSIILMVLAEPNPKGKSEEITAGSANDAEQTTEMKELDLDFVNVLRHFENSGVPVPKLYHYNIGFGLLYIEDLGDELLEYSVAKMDEKRKKQVYFSAIEHIVDIHHEATNLANPDFVGFRRAFEERLLYLEMMHYVDYAIKARRKLEPSPEDVGVFEDHMARIAKELAVEPRVVVHRDFQSRNLLFKNEKLRVIDFQDALMGTRQYDLVALLRDSYVELSWDLIEACIEKYCELVEKLSGAKIDRKHFMRIFHLQSLQRKIKDTGRFDYIDIVKGNPNFLKYIPLSRKYVREAFDRLPEHAALRKALGKYTPEIL